MARRNPNQGSPHPAKRWFEWNGEVGNLRYYDKELEKNVDVEIPFQFILLDRLAVVKGWHDPSQSGITSNEVRRIMDEPMTVRAFKMKDPIARGFYSDIKDRVKAAGGRFNTNLYIAFNDEDGELQLGSLMLHGSAMSAWFEFENNKEIKPYLYQRGISIESYVEGKKGKIVFRVPQFMLVTLPAEVDQKAEELQKVIDAHLEKYFAYSDREDEPPPPKSAFQKAKAEMEDEEDEIPF